MSDLEKAPRTTKWLELIVDNQTPDFKITRRTKMVADYKFEGARVETTDVIGTIVMSTVSLTGVKEEKTDGLTLREKRMKRLVDALKPVVEDVRDA